ncbi:MAG: hypothetical protein HY048_14860 [Acidobacteria bacterium]|nr:hypothetical protein [Acidobacteriota bacterium]
MIILIAALVMAGAAYFAGMQIAGELRAAREEASRGRTAALLQTFAPAQAAAQADPRALLAWQPVAKTARGLFPEEFAALDRAAGGTFPFTKAQFQAAHDRWTADWLAWERTHDAEYKLKAAVAEQELTASGGSALGRSKLEAVDREKLDLYQRRYQEYVRVAKALQALIS